MFASNVVSFSVFTLLLVSVKAVHLNGRDLNGALMPSYDYIIVGGGISGLVVANRLSETPEVSVLVIEAGNADNYEEFIQVPQFVGSDVGSQYDWKLGTAPQTFLDGMPRPYPQGKVLGGGSILNAMCWNRGGSDDFDSWERLGNPGWGWQDMLPYFRKSETFTPAPPDKASQFSIRYDPFVHGTTGPVQVGFPKYFYNQSVNFFAALATLGMPAASDPNDGMSAGAAFIPTDIDPRNQTRSDARRTYYDPIASRRNLHVITGQYVTRVTIAGIQGNEDTTLPTTEGNIDGNGGGSGLDGSGIFGNGSNVPPPPKGKGDGGSQKVARALPVGLRITGVEFAPNAASTRQNISATREVIVAAGALHSAQLLQLSGIGPRPLLETFGVPVAIDLPGVGNNMQDHYLVGTFYPYNNVSFSPANLTQNATYNAEAKQQYYSQRDGPWTAGSPNGLAFPSLPSISNISANILQAAADQNANDHLQQGLDPTVIAGYRAQKDSLVMSLSRSNIAAWEIINNNIGSLTVAIMHPFSRGTVYINSPEPFQPPTIDPRYGSNPIDLQILIEALKFNRRILQSEAMVELAPAQFVPPADADDDALLRIIKDGIRTEYHPSGTLAMLPREGGGVVDPHLRVYGTQNLRVVDAGIFPLIPAAHLQANVYAVAEKAADIIKADNLDVIPSPASSLSSPTGSVAPSVSVNSGLSSPAAATTASTPSASIEVQPSTAVGQSGPPSNAPSSSSAGDTPSSLPETSVAVSSTSSAVPAPAFSFDPSNLVIPIPSFTTITITVPPVTLGSVSFGFTFATSFPVLPGSPALSSRGGIFAALPSSSTSQSDPATSTISDSTNASPENQQSANDPASSPSPLSSTDEPPAIELPQPVATTVLSPSPPSTSLTSPSSSSSPSSVSTATEPSPPSPTHNQSRLQAVIAQSIAWLQQLIATLTSSKESPIKKSR